MDQLKILADLSELKLLRDLATFAHRRAAVTSLEDQAKSIQKLMASEADRTAKALSTSQSSSNIFAAYAENAQRRLSLVSQQKRAAEAEAAMALKTALRAQGRARAIEILQTRAQIERKAAAARRNEAVEMGHQAALHGTPNLL